MSVEDRFECIKRSRLCHKYFNSRHRTPLYKKVNSCTVEGCTNPFHYMLLHFTRKRSPAFRKTAPEVSSPNTDDSPQNTIAIFAVLKASDSEANVYFCIVPVRIRYKENEALTYAFLDLECTHIFCDKNLFSH